MWFVLHQNHDIGMDFEDVLTVFLEQVVEWGF